MYPNLEHDAPIVSPYDLSMVKTVPLSMVKTVHLEVDKERSPWHIGPPKGLTISLLYSCWRTMMDFTFGLFGLLMLLLILPIIALLIYANSPGPIFYSQERVGYRGKKFRMHKFRSMGVNAEQAGRAAWTSKNDARVTQVGRILRATHLDELPQALNILCGEMSLIGPRPEREEYVAELEKTDPLYRSRLVIKPGLTGWSQVNYGYGSTSNDELEKLQYDLYYIEHQSFTFDVLIILKTIVEVVLCHGI
jgi:lipopolysaccharide/colanic/teichoic acid biosynthesis glycosyltransferase